MLHRPDLDILAIAQRWLSGEPILSLATSLETSEATIRRRLIKARKIYPELPWDARQKPSRVGPTSEYTSMNDGKQGTAAIRTTGYIIRSSAACRRGR